MTEIQALDKLSGEGLTNQVREKGRLINNFPEILKNFLEKDFFPEYKKYLWFLKKEYKGKLTRTDNDSEMYFHATLPKSEKKRFRTEQGIFNQIFNRKNGWMKKIKSQLTK